MTQTSEKSLEKFGEFVVKTLRDKAIEQNEMLLDGKLRGKAIQSLQSRVALFSDEQKTTVREMVRDLLDVALHDFMFAVQDAHDRDLGIEVLVDGQNVAQLSGALHEDAIGPEGWVERFSAYPVA